MSVIWGGRCPGCHVSAGSEHDGLCEYEACAVCGFQITTCRCPKGTEPYEREVEDLGGRLPWKGDFHGFAEARWFGFYCHLELTARGSSWVPCTADTPCARPDLSALAKNARWDKKTRTYVLREKEPVPTSAPCSYCGIMLKAHKPTFMTYYGEDDGRPSDGHPLHTPERCRDVLFGQLQKKVTT